MFEIIKLVAVAALVATVVGGAVAAWHSFTGRYIDEGKVAQKTADEPILKKAQADQQEAETERDHAKADTASCVATAQTQSDMVDLWQHRAQQNAAAAQAARAQAQREATAQAPRIAELQAKAAAAPKLMACEQERDLAKATLRDALRARRGIAAPAAK